MPFPSRAVFGAAHTIVRSINMSAASHSKLQKGASSFKLLTAGTPNGHKASILLEELKDAYPNFSYDFEGISFKDNEQKEEWFLQVNPNGRIPAAIVFPEKEGGAPHYLFESASITLWLAEHVDKENKFSFEDPFEHSEALSWVFFGHGGVGESVREKDMEVRLIRAFHRSHARVGRQCYVRVYHTNCHVPQSPEHSQGESRPPLVTRLL